MFIIWGTTGRETLLGVGHFHCPHCQRRSSFRHIHVARYFTLYFIPTFKTQDLGEFIRCDACQQNFYLDVLHAKLPAQDDDVKQLREDLETGIAIEQAREELLDAGLDKEETNELIQRAAGRKRVRCAPCSLSFVASVPRCTTCEGKLTPV